MAGWLRHSQGGNKGGSPLALQMLPKQDRGREQELGVRRAGVGQWEKEHVWVMLAMEQTHLLMPYNKQRQMLAPKEIGREEEGMMGHIRKSH